MLAAVVLAALLAAQDVPDALVAVTVQPSGTRQAVTVVASRPEVLGDVRRDGDEILVDVAAPLRPDVTAPAPAGLVERVTLQPVGNEAARVTISVVAGMPHEVVRRGAQLTVYVGRPGELVPVSDVYGLLFPEAVTTDPGEASAPEDDEAVLELGAIDPSLAVLFTSGRGTFPEGSLEPQEDDLWELRPRVETSVSVGLLDLRPSYELRKRMGSRFESNNDVSHLANLGLSMPIGPALRLTGSYDFIRGRAEATTADPGGEFFYGRTRFTRHDAKLDLAWELGALTRVFVQGNHGRLDVDDAGFVSYRRNAVSSGVRRDLGPRLVGEMQYQHDWIPSTDRGLVEGSTNTVGAALRGDITPRLTGTASVGYARRTSPQAVEPARTRSDLVAGIALRQELTPSMTVTLNLSRSQNVSAFEQNPFYVAEVAGVDVTAPLPWQISLTASAGYHRNRYFVESAAAGAPRRDRIRSWGVGLARPIGAWGYLRADYQESSRKSNIADFTFDTDGVTVQLVVRPFNRGEERRQ